MTTRTVLFFFRPCGCAAGYNECLKDDAAFRDKTLAANPGFTASVVEFDSMREMRGRCPTCDPPPQPAFQYSQYNESVAEDLDDLYSSWRSEDEYDSEEA